MTIAEMPGERSRCNASPACAIKSPLVVAYGMGVDSTAMLLGMYQRDTRPDKILFADTGSEKPDTYAYLPVIQAWLASVGFPPVEVVKRHPTKSRKSGGVYTTLEENCPAIDECPHDNKRWSQ